MPDVPDKLFVYGLLMYPALCRQLTGRRFARERAHLRGYARLTLARGGGPPIAAASPQADGVIEGVLLHRVDVASLAILDLFEGVADGLYQRREVEVRGERAGLVPAQVYVCGARAQTLLVRQPWDERAFRKAYYAHYHERVIPQFLRECR